MTADSSDPDNQQQDDLKKRLEAARTRYGLDRDTAGKPAGRDAADGENISQGVRAGIDLTVPVFAGLGLGYLLDEFLGTLPLFMILFLLLGIGTGFWNVYKMTVADEKTPSKDLPDRAGEDRNHAQKDSDNLPGKD